MSTMAMASSSLNPNAPLFIPAAYRQVEDFSPEWWELVKTTAWFRDHWFRQHQLHEAAYDAALLSLPDDADVDVAALLPDDSVDLLDMVGTDDLFYAPDHHHQAAKPAAYDLDVLRAVSLGSPRAVVGAPSPRAQQQRHADKPAQHVGVRGAARRVIHQPR
ncbi:hypothetical protein SEVIR_2G433100v4 [Setaria viridis]|uniref:Ataxin-2 C-terminal domain-containing protein n=2 Tax=Setaria TaxID=4554 RepID=K3ZXL6_SETIT|nr:protein EARLY RESPONSIVE TO DEHYDRATION 15 [Setaria italica]XP_034582996.1 protein EARLY RESPONSIVE TO DEHYDRATION 15-like [Setaria viridis]RCV14376.1 hypothetical protein SETIT_2G420700v2 [Setaria italica]TKW36319.1 hypothetical protein SEVIR_2G433100v2 [Setaria viridis]